MPITYDWRDESKTAMVYTVTGDDWTWNDYHRTANLSLFPMVNVMHPVHVVVDFRAATGFPRGAVAHLRSIGKPKEYTRLSGHAVLVGLPDDLRLALTGAPDAEEIAFADHTIAFAPDLDSADALLAALG